MLSVEDAYSGYNYSYDGLGRLTSFVASLTGLPEIEFTQAFDDLSRRTSLAAEIDGTPDFLNTYQYDALSRMTRIEQTGQANGHAVAEKRVDLEYNLVHELTTLVRYRDTSGGSSNIVADSSYVRDNLGRLISLEHVWNMTTLAEYAWTYDTLNRVTEFETLDGTSTYSYDAISQLVAADHTGASLPADEAYSFDAAGNRTMSGYSIGTNNQLLSDGVYNYTYDAEGNRLTATRVSSAPADDYKIEYQWDHRGRLVGLTFRDNNLDVTKRVRYTYDVFDRLIAKEVDADADNEYEIAQRWVYDGPDIVLGFVDPDGEGTDPAALAVRHLHGPLVDQILTEEHFVPLLEIGDTQAAAGDVRWPLADNLGTIRDIAIWNSTQAETEIANHLIYDTAGRIVSQTSLWLVSSSTGDLRSGQRRGRRPAPSTERGEIGSEGSETRAERGYYEPLRRDLRLRLFARGTSSQPIESPQRV